MRDYILLPDERLDEINENLSIIQLKDGLTFGTDSYLLSAFVKKNAGRGADLGSGTGVAALLCLQKGKMTFVTASEIQPRFAELIRRNASLNGFADKVRVVFGDVRSLSVDDTKGQLDTVISNPPYLKANEGFSTKTPEMNIARRELNGTIFDFCTAASRLLRHGGFFYTVYRPDRLADLIYSLKSNNLEPKRLVTVYPDTASKPCLVLIESKKGAASSINHSLPLFIYKDSSREYTEQMNRVYEECSLDFLF